MHYHNKYLVNSQLIRAQNIGAHKIIEHKDEHKRTSRYIMIPFHFKNLSLKCNGESRNNKEGGMKKNCMIQSNPEIYHRVYKIPPLVLLKQINPFYSHLVHLISI